MESFDDHVTVAAISGREADQISSVPPAAIGGGVISGSVAILDSNKAMARMGGKDIYLRVLEKFILHRGDSVHSIRNALAIADLQKAEHLVHTLKGISATIGADALSESSRQLEFAIRQGDGGQYAQLLESAESEMGNALFQVVAYMKAHEIAPELKVQSSGLVSLIEQLTGQLEIFDSQASGTMLKIRQQVKDTAIEKRFTQLDRFIDAYDYENALVELHRFSGEIA